jgi:transcriptional regulator with XRE-family HTH domain
MSPSSYSRIERGETTVNIDELPSIAQKLNVPIIELLPEILSMHSSNNNSTQSGIICGNIYNYNYYDKDSHIQHLNEKIQQLETKIKDFTKD